MDRTLLRTAYLLLMACCLSTLIVTASRADAQTSPPPISAPPAQIFNDRFTLTYTQSPNGAILIPVLLNGNTPATFLLDTGFRSSCITDRLVKQLRLTPQPAFGPGGKPSPASGESTQFVILPVQLGPVKNSKGLLDIVNADELHLNALAGQTIDGIIGANVLAVLPCFLDFQKHQVTFFLKRSITAQQLQSLGMQDAVKCPLTYHPGTDFYSVSVHMVNGSDSVDENLTIDSSSGSTLLSEQSATQLHLVNISQSSLQTGFGDLAIGTGLLPRLSFPAALTLNDQTVSYAKGPMPNGVPGLLGRDMLSQFQVLLDFAHNEMYVRPNPSAALAVATPPVSSPH